MPRNLHAIVDGASIALVDRQPGPYSHSGPVETELFRLSTAEWSTITGDVTAGQPTVAPTAAPEPPKESQS